MVDNSKHSIIYILSSGRSGSTILEMLLNSVSEIFTLGEVQLLFKEAKLNKKCGCGNELTKCPFWSSIINEMNIENSLGLFRKTFKYRDSHYGKVIRLNRLFEILLNRKPYKLAVYLKDNMEMFNLINEDIQKKCVLVDSSKDNYRFWYLSKSANLRLLPIHLYKEPEEFVYSMIKRSSGIKRIYLIIRFSLRWYVENQISHWVLKRSKVPYLKVRYKNLAENPQKELEKVINFFNIQTDSQISTVGIRGKTNHGVSGNQSRFRNDEICYDNSWMSNLSKLECKLISFFSLGAKW